MPRGASLQSAKADLLRAETELKRVEKASQSRAVSEMDVDRARADRDMAIAAVAAGRANLDEAELNYSYTDVVRPSTVSVSRQLVDPGNLVGQSGPTQLTRVNKLQPIYVYFHAPESVVLGFMAEQAQAIVRGSAKGEDQGEAQVALANEDGLPPCGAYRLHRQRGGYPHRAPSRCGWSWRTRIWRFFPACSSGSRWPGR